METEQTLTPIPQLGKCYIDKDGDVIRVKKIIVDDNEQIETISVNYISSASDSYDILVEDWNKRDLKTVTFEVATDIIKKRQEYIDALRTEGNKVKSSLLNEFLWSLAGVDKALLKTCPGDWSKQSTKGALILVIGILAWLSGYFITYNIFKNSITALIIAIVWGGILFNLERYMVITAFSDGKRTISKHEFTSALPRIIMTILLGITISFPIELQIFNSSIENQLIQEREQLISLEKEILLLKEEQSRLTKEFSMEITDGYGHHGRSIKHRLDEIHYLLSLKERLLSQKMKSSGVNILKPISSENIDLTEKIVMLNKISSWSNNPSICIIRLVLSLLIITTSVLPILVVITENGKYVNLISMEKEDFNLLKK